MNSAGWRDPVGDGNAGPPDITTVTVSNTEEEVLTVRVEIPGTPVLTDNLRVHVFLDGCGPRRLPGSVLLSTTSPQVATGRSGGTETATGSPTTRRQLLRRPTLRWSGSSSWASKHLRLTSAAPTSAPTFTSRTSAATGSPASAFSHRIWNGGFALVDSRLGHDFLRTTVAHEIFHLIQYVYFLPGGCPAGSRREQPPRLRVDSCSRGSTSP